jgi:hypothetical protein
MLPDPTLAVAPGIFLEGIASSTVNFPITHGDTPGTMGRHHIESRPARDARDRTCPLDCAQVAGGILQVAAVGFGITRIRRDVPFPACGSPGWQTGFGEN